MTLTGAWWAVPAALVVSWAVIALRLRFATLGLDQPNHRSLHQRPTPHGGGLGIVAALLAAGLGLDVPGMLLAAVFALAVLSLLDDAWHLPFWLRLAAHLAAAAVFCHLLDLPGLVWLPAMLAVGWMTNLYNFMDGADGLAGAQGVAGFAAYAAAFAVAGDGALAAWCTSIAAGCAGFLRFNWPPARIFMGDVGSIPLGFLAGALGLLGFWRGHWPAWLPMVAFAPFILDASVTLMRRAAAGRPVWEAHREHVYQRMVAAGYGHGGMTWRWSVLMAAGAVLACALLVTPAWVQWTGTAVWLGILLSLGRRMDQRCLAQIRTERNR